MKESPDSKKKCDYDFYEMDRETIDLSDVSQEVREFFRGLEIGLKEEVHIEDNGKSLCVIYSAKEEPIDRCCKKCGTAWKSEYIEERYSKDFFVVGTNILVCPDCRFNRFSRFLEICMYVLLVPLIAFSIHSFYVLHATVEMYFACIFLVLIIWFAAKNCKKMYFNRKERNENRIETFKAGILDP